MRNPQQLQFNFKPRDATPEEVQKWQEEELEPLGRIQIPFVAFYKYLYLGLC